MIGRVPIAAVDPPSEERDDAVDHGYDLVSIRDCEGSSRQEVLLNVAHEEGIVRAGLHDIASLLADG
jgi:hypothetical protein